MIRRRGALVAALALAAAGCGGGADPAPADDALTVRHLREERTLRTVALDCAGADAPVCRGVAELLPSLRPVEDEFCTKVYGGPWRIALEGRLDGRPVAIEIGRRDGCQIARYDRLAGALGRAAPPRWPEISGGG